MARDILTRGRSNGKEFLCGMRERERERDGAMKEKKEKDENDSFSLIYNKKDKNFG